MNVLSTDYVKMGSCFFFIGKTGLADKKVVIELATYRILGVLRDLDQRTNVKTRIIEKLRGLPFVD